MSSCSVLSENQSKELQDVEKYVKSCHLFDVKVDPSVVISLLSGWEILQPTKEFKEGALLPLIEILQSNDHVKKLRMASSSMHDSRTRSAGNGNANARALAMILKINKSIEDVDLSDTGLDNDGISELCDAIRANNSIVKLNLSSNHFNEIGAERLRNALADNKTIKYLDISRNALGFQSISALVKCCSPKQMTIETSGNFVFEEVLNSVTHGIAFLFAVVGSILLITEVSESKYSDYHFWSCFLYSFALMFLFLSSCLFHSFFMMPTTSRILQILDHVGIYMVIAGSYTPFLLISLHHHTSARVLLSAEWIAAVCGATFAAVSDLNAPFTTAVELMVFLTMGLGVLYEWTHVVSDLSPPAFALLALGGASYLLGIPFFILGERKPIYHVVWHLFVVMGAALHWFDVYFFVVGIEINHPIVNDVISKISATIA